jgi:serine/threonine protein kinase
VIVLDPTRFHRVAELFEEARHKSPGDGAAFLDRACAGEPEIRDEVERLLRQHEREGDVFDNARPVMGLITQAVATECPMPDRIGGFRIIRVLGEGGMGIVYLAQQDQPARQVALKVIRPEVLSGRMLKRFQFEAEVLGRLSHPGIAQVFEAGMFDYGGGGRPYFAMEFVEGETLTKFAVRKRLAALVPRSG